MKYLTIEYIDSISNRNFKRKLKRDPKSHIDQGKTNLR